MRYSFCHRLGLGIQDSFKRLASRVVPYRPGHSGSLNLSKTKIFFRTGFLTSNFFSCGFYSVFILSQVRVGIQILTKRLASRMVPYMSGHSGSLNLLKTKAFFRTVS
jgi:hypothetical protein